MLSLRNSQRAVGIAALAVALAGCGAAAQPPVDTAAQAAATSTPVLATAAPAPQASPMPSAVPPTATPLPPEETAVPTADKPDPQPTPARTAVTRPASQNERVPTPDPGAAVTGEVPEALLAPVLADAAQRSGATTDQIVVTMAKAVEWSDSSLGCPQPGMSYLQVILPGYHVTLEAGGNAYDYRLDDRGNFRLCTTG